MKLTAALERNHCRSVSSAAIIPHLVRHYGAQASTILDVIAAEPRLGEPLYDGLPYCLAELAYLCESENVGRLLDLVKRRTPLYFLTDNGSLGSLRQVVEHVAPILGWSPARQAEEWAAVGDEFRDDTQAFADQGDLQTDKSERAGCA